MAKMLSVFTLLLLFAFGCASWQGSLWMYVLFSGVYFILIFIGIHRRVSFGYIFLVITLFIGYWLKLTLHVIFGHAWSEPTGLFDFSRDSWDSVAELSIIGAVSTILAGLCWKGRMEDGPTLQPVCTKNKTRTLLWLIALANVTLIVILNECLDIQHAGIAPKDLGWPWPLQGLFNWYMGANLIFLLGVIYLELLRTEPPWYGILTFLLSISAVAISYGSRGTLAFQSMLLIGGLIFFGRQFCWMSKRRLIVIVMLCGCAVVVVAAVAQMRREAFRFQVVQVEPVKMRSMTQAGLIYSDYTLIHLINLPIERWIGLEGLMAVSSYPNKGMDLLTRAIGEEGIPGRADMYTSEISKSGTSDTSTIAYVTMPGIFAYWYYSGSSAIMFGAVLLLVTLMITGERAVRTLTGNPFLAMSIGVTLAIGINMSPGGIFVPTAMMGLSVAFALFVGFFIKKLVSTS